MSFLHVNGSAFAIAGDRWTEIPKRVAEIAHDTVGGSPIFHEGVVRRSWEATTPPMLPSAYAAARARIEGRGQAWGFTNGQMWNGNGIDTLVVGTRSVSSSGGRLATSGRNGYLSIGASSVWGVNLANKMGAARGWSPGDGFTIGFWSYRSVAADGVGSTGWHFCALVGAAVFARGTANPAGITQYRSDPGAPGTAPTTGNHNLGQTCSLEESSPWFALHGYELDGGSSAQLFSDVFVVPWQMTAAEIAAIYNLLRVGGETPDGISVHGLLPFVLLHGDCTEDATPIVARARVVRVGYLGGNSDGTWRNNLRVLELLIEEVDYVWTSVATAPFDVDGSPVRRTRALRGSRRAALGMLSAFVDEDWVP